MTLFDKFPTWILGLGASLCLALPAGATPGEPAPTIVRLEVDAPWGVWGRPLMAAALVSGPQGLEPPSGGWVTFLADGKSLGTRPLVAGRALITAAVLTAGPHALMALYGGTGAWAASASATRQVRVEPVAPPPDLEVWALPDGATTRVPILSLRGRASSPLGPPRVEVAGQEVPLGPDGTFTWAHLARDGENRITVIARDRAGRETRRERTITVQYSAPSITLDPPGDGAWLPDREVQVSGQLAEVPGGQDGPRLSYAVNGGPFSQVPLQGTDFAFPLALEPGPNVLWVRLELPDGSESWACRTLFQRPGPALDIQEPGDPILTALDTQSVSGTAPGQIQCALDGTTLLLDAPGGAFGTEMPLPALGMHLAVARLTGPDGETREVRRPIIRAAFKVPVVYSLEDVKRTLDVVAGLEPEKPGEDSRLDVAPLGNDQGWGNQRLDVDDAAVQLVFAQGVW
ncbi:MAG TPA: Ig-like domain repeat protein [Holophaga sp.]|nr:Ig-like domain repeat protein [Holophaga sp.]